MSIKKQLEAAQQSQADEVNAALGTNVRVSQINSNEWAVSGDKRGVKRASLWIVLNCNMTITGNVYDRDERRQYCYMKPNN